MCDLCGLTMQVSGILNSGAGNQCFSRMESAGIFS